MLWEKMKNWNEILIYAKNLSCWHRSHDVLDLISHFRFFRPLCTRGTVNDWMAIYSEFLSTLPHSVGHASVPLTCMRLALAAACKDRKSHKSRLRRQPAKRRRRRSAGRRRPIAGRPARSRRLLPRASASTQSPPPDGLDRKWRAGGRGGGRGGRGDGEEEETLGECLGGTFSLKWRERDLVFDYSLFSPFLILWLFILRRK